MAISQITLVKTHITGKTGFNNPDNEWDKKQIDFYVLVGDSFKGYHGACVNRPYDIAVTNFSLSFLLISKATI